MKIAIILSAVDKASRIVNSTVGKIKKGLNTFGNYAAIGGVAATLFFSKAISAAEDSEIANARLSQVFKSMGQNYKAATAASAAYASGLQTQIGVEDETIMAVQAKLATFEKASNAAARANGIYNRATAASFDMAAAGFGDAENNIVQLGKALQDPVTGINALRRSGITFTEAEKKKIAVLVKTNKIFDAQKMVMKAIEKQVGGVAGATVSRTQKMRIAWGEVMEQIGTRLLPIFTKFASFILERVIPAVQGFIDKHPGLVKWLAIAGVSLLVLGTAAKVAAFGMSGLTGALNILKFAFMLVGKTITFVGRLFLTNPILLIATAIAVIVFLVIKHWKKISAFFVRLWAGIKQVFRAALKIILDITLAPVRAIIWLWGKISDFFVGLWNGIVATVTKVWNDIGNAITKPIRWIMEKWQDFKDWFSNLFGGITAKMEKMVEKTREAQRQMAKQFNEQAAKTISGVGGGSATIEMLHKLSGSGRNGRTPKTNTPTPSPVPVSRAGSGQAILNYNPTITIGAGTDPSDFKTMLNEHAGHIKKMMDEVQRKKDRTKF